METTHFYRPTICKHLVHSAAVDLSELEENRSDRKRYWNCSWKGAEVQSNSSRAVQRAVSSWLSEAEAKERSLRRDPNLSPPNASCLSPRQSKEEKKGSAAVERTAKKKRKPLRNYSQMDFCRREGSSGSSGEERVCSRDRQTIRCFATPLIGPFWRASVSVVAAAVAAATAAADDAWVYLRMID